MKPFLLILLTLGCLGGCTSKKGSPLTLPEVNDSSIMTGVLITDKDRFDIESKYVSTFIVEVDGKKLPYIDASGRKITYTVIFIYDKPLMTLYISNGQGLPYKIILE
jgi:hypothetical protein